MFRLVNFQCIFVFLFIFSFFASHVCVVWRFQHLKMKMTLNMCTLWTNMSKWKCNKTNHLQMFKYMNMSSELLGHKYSVRPRIIFNIFFWFVCMWNLFICIIYIYYSILKCEKHVTPEKNRIFMFYLWKLAETHCACAWPDFLPIFQNQ